MRHIPRESLRAAVLVPLVAMALSACETAPPTRTTSRTTSSIDPTTVNYPDGTYKLYGDGSSTPYYWVWIPKGTAVPILPPSPPPVLSRGTVVTQPGVVVAQPGVVVTQPAVPTPPAVTMQTGRYQLYGDGVSTPYYWAWIPSGAAPPAPPPLPTRP
jgi:hypothetical protein